MFYPFKFEPVYKDYIWGGRRLEQLGKKLPYLKVAESWEIACHPEGTSIIANGEFKGLSLPDILKAYGRSIIGTAMPKLYLNRFPLLAKFIDANDNLSVQIHPNDNYAYLKENGAWGKSEMFYVIEADPGAKIICGVKPEYSMEEIKTCFRGNEVQECLKYIEVKPGDVINVPPGVVHAIGKGVVIAEIEQNSNITYRIYDYNRIDKNGLERPLHIEKALSIFDYDKNVQSAMAKGVVEQIDKNSSIIYWVENKYYSVDEYLINGIITEDTMGKTFHIYMFLDGEVELEYEKESITIRKGETIFIPASLGKYKISGNFKALKAYVPDIKQKLMIYLKNAGYIEEEIYDVLHG